MAGVSKVLILFACIVVFVIANQESEGKNGCILKDGKLLKEKQFRKSNCFKYMCLKKKGKFFLKSVLRKNKCCKLESSVVPNHWTSLIGGNLTRCSSGKLQVNQNTSKKVARKEMEKSILRELFKFDNLGVNIRSLENSLPGIDVLIGGKGRKRKTSELLIREFKTFIKKHNNTGYIHGIENLVNLIENRKLKNLITSRINQLRKKNGYKEMDLRNDNGTTNNRVFMGKLAKEGQFPFQARLIVQRCKYQIQCGGVLVSPCHILTAKHCIEEIKSDPQHDVHVTLGSIWPWKDEASCQFPKVQYITSHPSEDIAILKLMQTPTSSGFVKTIPIWHDPDYSDQTIGFVSGYGYYNSLNENSDFLRFRASVIPKWIDCGLLVTKNVNWMCNSANCQGDSGGPVIIVRHKTSYLWGIHIMFMGNPVCDNEGITGIAVDVAFNGPILGWIKKEIGSSLGTKLSGYSFTCSCDQPNGDCKQKYVCPLPSPAIGAGCFSSSSTTVLDDGQIKPLRELIVGDKILAGNKQGKPIFSKFIGWLHKNERKKATFLKISSKIDGITLTPEHLILSKSNDHDENIKYVFAKNIKIGDHVIKKLDNNTFTWATVTKIQQQIETGVFAPLTEDGTVVVDGILASTYAWVDHDLAHAAFSIVRYFPAILEDVKSQHYNGIRTFPKILSLIARMLNFFEEDVPKEDDWKKTFSTTVFFAFALWMVVLFKKKM